MRTKKNKTSKLDQFKNKHYGEKGTAKRDMLEANYENFKIDVLGRGLTQEELAEKVKTTK